MTGHADQYQQRSGGAGNDPPDLRRRRSHGVGMATWQSGGSVLFTSSDCTTGAYVYSSTSGGARATTQLQTSLGMMLYVGAIGTGP